MRHLLGIDGLPTGEILGLLDRAEAYFVAAREGRAVERTLAGRAVVNLFFESSTRTRTSFEIAEKRLGADVINVSVQTSSVSKGETLLDTATNLDAMRPHAIVVRHASSGAPHRLARHLRAHVVNAGDGSHEHPTQALLDAFTIRRHKGRIEGLVVVIAGDIAHSRVARSNALLLRALGATVRVAAPRTLLPASFDHAFGCEVVDSLERALVGADVVMMLRIQLERIVGGGLPSLGEYARTFGLDRRRLGLAKPDAIVMHPGPMNRGVEIANDVADGSRSVILEQVEAGVAVRAAVLAGLSPLGA